MSPGAFKVFAQMCKDAGLPEPVKEWEFHYERKFRFDVAWPSSDYMLALECDGGVWTGGRHVTGTGFLKDHEKRNLAACEGWRIIYTTPKRLHTIETIELTRAALLG